MDALETVMLIKQAKDKGLNLGAAIEAARRFRERQSGEVPLRESRSSLLAPVARLATLPRRPRAPRC